VALKRLHRERAGDAASRRRFVQEAEITGRLEHPGVVPVYGLAEEAGRPGYAMRFIQGETLYDALKHFHAADRPGRDPGERGLALRQLLNRFLAVCHTVAYAHSRGIVHRDLKPRNIMLGKYGETLVVDWGLAKAFTRDEAARASGEETLAPTVGGDPGATQQGQVVGTPAYMSPEQANGRSDQVGPASDIYSLGATLYVVLTGQPPVPGGPVSVMLEQVRRGDILRPRQQKAGVPPALEAVCLKAMALRPADRYPTAQALAADVEQWLAGEPVAAYPESWLGRLGRWGRRHRPLVAGLAAALLVALVLGGGGWVWLERQEADRREELARLEGRDRQAIETALEQAEAFLREARWADAEAALGQAAGRLANGGADDLKQRLRQAQDTLRLVKRLDEIRLEAATLVDGKWNPRKAGPAYAAAFKEHGLDVLAGEEAELGRRLAASPVKEQLVAALEDWVGRADDRTAARLLGLARRADPDAERNQFRDPAVWRDRQQLTLRAQQADVKRLSPALLAVVGWTLEELGGPGLELLERGQRCYPGDFWLNFHLANALNRKNRARWAEAAGYYRAALATRLGTVAVYNNLGTVLKDKGDLDGAIAQFKQALALDPKCAPGHNNLGTVLKDKGDLDGAIAQFKQALALDPKLARAHNGLGNALADKGDLDGAIAEYKQALALDPKDAKAHYNLGNALYAKRDLAGAIAQFKQAVALDRKFAPAHYNLGAALYAKRDLDGAIAEYKQALALDPKYAQAHNNLGTALAGKGDLDGAVYAFKQALALNPKYAMAHYGLGLALYYKQDLDGAIAEYKQALALDPKYARAHNNLGTALYAKRDLAGAIAEYKQALALDPKYAMAHIGLGRALLDKGRFAEARAATRRALQLLGPAHPLRNRATQQLRQAEQWLKLDARLSAFLKGDAQPADAGEQIALAELCQRIKKRYAAAARLYTGAFAADTKLAGDLQRQHRYNAACVAALAAAGKGEDAAKLEAKERARLRRQALAWLQADLAAWAQVAAKTSAQDKPQVRRTLEHWQRDSDLAGVRDKAALAKLPKEEQQAWHKLWADVEAVRKRAQAK
jgi:tetratricopeptide (TPR) repeat protein/tRNA A-37 threonylcarbamoyl transferase component Bud32